MVNDMSTGRLQSMRSMTEQFNSARLVQYGQPLKGRRSDKNCFLRSRGNLCFSMRTSQMQKNREDAVFQSSGVQDFVARHGNGAALDVEVEH